MRNLIKLKKIPIKRYGYPECPYKDIAIRLKYNEVFQKECANSKSFNRDYYLNQIQRFLKFKAHKENEDGILIFRDVSEHNDNWGKVGKYKPYFIHVMLSGSGEIRIHRANRIVKKLEVSKGDVFILDPNYNHSYKHLRGKFTKTIVFTVGGIKLEE